MSLVEIPSLINLSQIKTISPTTIEPFYKYELYIYGKRYEIPAICLNSLYMKYSLNTNGLQYIIYRDSNLTKPLLSDSISLDTKFDVDALSLFYQSNPTYKDQFNSQMWQRGIQSLVGVGSGIAAGAIAGSVVPGIGTVAGAVVGGAAATATSIGFAVHQNNLMLEGISKKPNQMFGDSSSTGLLHVNRFSIYIQEITPENRSKMLTEYYLRGFPTSVITNIDNMSIAYNAIYGNCKYIKGSLIKTFGNVFISNQIDKKLNEGVVII